MPPPLKRVSKLVITFLVDNTIEWMSKLPPGFTHEILHQVKHSPHDLGKGVPVLNFNDFCCGAHGFAALLETEVLEAPDASELSQDLDEVPFADVESVTSSIGTSATEARELKRHLTLFDTGPDALSLVRNIRAMQVPITQIERVVTSHWHADHTGGLLSFLKLRNECAAQGITTPRRTSGTGTAPDDDDDPLGSSTSPTQRVPLCIVDVHPDRPVQRGIAPAPYQTVMCAHPLDPSFEQITALGGVLDKRDDGHIVAGGTVYVSGEIPRVTDFEGGLPSGVRWVEPAADAGKWVSEPHLMDERYAAVDVEGKGLVLFSSCSHAGIVNVIRDAVNTFDRPVYMIVGGLHLAPPDLHYRIAPTVEFLSNTMRPSPTYILPMHCTGFKAKVALEHALGDGVVPTGVGHRVEILGNGGDHERTWGKV